MEIEEAFFSAVAADFPALPIAFPGVNFTPPAAENWIEVSLIRAPLAMQPLANRRGVEQGVMQIQVFTRPGLGTLALTALAVSAMNLYPMGRAFATGHRIIDNPSMLSPLVEPDRISIPISFTYSA